MIFGISRRNFKSRRLSEVIIKLEDRARDVIKIGKVIEHFLLDTLSGPIWLKTGSSNFRIDTNHS